MTHDELQSIQAFIRELNIAVRAMSRPALSSHSKIEELNSAFNALPADMQAVCDHARQKGLEMVAEQTRIAEAAQAIRDQIFASLCASSGLSMEQLLSEQTADFVHQNITKSPETDLEVN